MSAAVHRAGGAPGPLPEHGRARAEPATIVKPAIHSLWIGSALSWLEQSCIESWLRHGHEVILWVYDTVEAIPPQVEVRDANDVMPLDPVFFNRQHASWGPAASVFRYKLQELRAGLWLDCDVYILSEILLDRDEPLFGLQKENLINNAVLYLPHDHPILAAIQEYIGRGDFYPWWETWLKRSEWRMKDLVSRKVSGRPHVPWGLLGPRLLTKNVEELGYGDKALPCDVFYPFGPKRAHEILSSAGDLRSTLTERTRGIHLWNNAIKSRLDCAVEPGSLAEAIRQGSL